MVSTSGLMLAEPVSASSTPRAAPALSSSVPRSRAADIKLSNLLAAVAVLAADTGSPAMPQQRSLFSMLPASADALSLPTPADALSPFSAATGRRTEETAASKDGEDGEDGGEDDTAAWFNLLSVTSLSFSAKFVADSYRSIFSRMLVDGSWIREVAWVVRTTGWRGTIGVHYRSQTPLKAVIAPGLKEGATDVPQSGIMFVEPKTPYKCPGLDVQFLGKRTLHVNTARWATRAESTIAMPHPNKVRMNIHIRPTYDVDKDRVAPHGLLGQTYDRDGTAVIGARDDYKPDENHHTQTKAQGEGAIEGVASDYMMHGVFSCDFKFSRFNEFHFAAPRNVSMLSGKKRPHQERKG
jgi:hypothetical protein